MLFVLFGSVFNGSKESALGGIKGIQYYTPTITAYGVMSACFVHLAIATTLRREQGLLKRVRGTPLSPVGYLGGLIANADAARRSSNLIFFVLIVISGGFFPIASTSVLSQIAQVFPLRHFIDAAFAAFDPHRSLVSFPWSDVGIMAAWGAAGLVVATRWFRWEPRRT